MEKMLRRVAPPLAGFALLALGNGLGSTLVSVRMAADRSTTLIGLVQAMYYAGLALGSVACARVIQRIGHARAYAAFAALAACTSLLYPMTSSPLLWALLRGCTGFAVVGLFIVTESWLSSAGGAAARGRVFSVYLVVNYLSLGGGQFLLRLGDPAGYELFSLVAILYLLALLPVTQAVDGEPPRGVGAARPGVAALLRSSPLGFGGCFAAGIASGSYHAMAPVHAAALGLPVAAFMGATIIAGLLLQWPIGRWSDGGDRRDVLATVSLLAAAVGFALAWMAPQAGAARWLLSCMFAALSFTLYGLTTSIANDRAGADHAVAASALLLLVFAIGACCGPPLAALAMQHFGPTALHGCSALVLGTLGVAAGVRRARAVRVA